MTLPRWKAIDEANLRRRIERLVLRGRGDSSALVIRTPRLVAPAGTGCADCRADRHHHAAKRVGPFLICRCLSCPVLVVEEPDRRGV